MLWILDMEEKVKVKAKEIPALSCVATNKRFVKWETASRIILILIRDTDDGPVNYGGNGATSKFMWRLLSN